jgi:hypothetical protein
MKKVFLIFAACVATVVSVFAQTPEATRIPDLRGAWKLIEETRMSINGKPIINSNSTIKLITENSFMWMSSLGEDLYNGASGSYTFDGEIITETISLGYGKMETEVGQKIVSEITVQGNRMYKTMTVEGVETTEEWEKTTYGSPLPPILQGVWREIEQNDIPVKNTRLLIEVIADDRFMWMMSNMEGRVFASAAGSYHLHPFNKGRSLWETITSWGRIEKKDKEYFTDIAIKGNRMYRNGTFDGEKTTEVWEKMDSVSEVATQGINVYSEYEYAFDTTFVWNPDKIHVSVPGMELEFIMPLENDPSGVANILFRNHQSDEVRLLDTIIDGRRHYRPLEPGFYDVILLYNNGKYFIQSNLLALRNGMNRAVGMDTEIQPADDDSRRWLTMRKFTAPIGGERKTTISGEPPSSQERILGYLLSNPGEIGRPSFHGDIYGPYNTRCFRMPPVFLSDDGYFESDLDDGYDWQLWIPYSHGFYRNRNLKIEPNTGYFIMMDDAPTPSPNYKMVGAE